MDKPRHEEPLVVEDIQGAIAEGTFDIVPIDGTEVHRKLTAASLEEFNLEEKLAIAEGRIEHLERMLGDLLDPLREIEKQQLMRVASEVLQRRGEYTVCGNLLVLAIELVWPEPAPRFEPIRKLGFDGAYGDMTVPLGKG